MKKSKNITQINTLLNHMAHGGTVTRLTALFNFKIPALTARISDLRRLYGIPITVVMKEDPNGGKYAEYSIKKKDLNKAVIMNQVHVKGFGTDLTYVLV